MFTIRPFHFTHADYAGITAIHNTLWPDAPRTTGSWKHADNHRNTAYFFNRLVAEAGNTIVAYADFGEPSWSYSPGKFYWHMEIHSDVQRHNVATVLYSRMTGALLERNASLLTTTMREDRRRRLEFLHARGYRQVLREPTSVLDVTQFDPTRYAALLDAVHAQGIQILSFSELGRIDPDWIRNVWELDWALHQDVPAAAPPTREPLAEFAKWAQDTEHAGLDSRFAARAGDQLVGMTNLKPNHVDPTRMHTGLTGVVRSHRRRGIATALKVHAIAYAQGRGVQRIDTDNEENNPMLALNLQLGFQPGPAWLHFEKQLASVDMYPMGARSVAAAMI